MDRPVIAPPSARKRRAAGLLAAVLAAAALPGWAGTLPEGEARALLAALKSHDEDEVRAALRHVRDADDPRFVAPLVELLRAASLGIAAGIDPEALARWLEDQSGQSFGAEWSAWVSWYAETSLAPPPGFTGWKGELLSRIDPRFGPLLPTGAPKRVRVEEIVWGGVSYEGIPALDGPKMIDPDEADWLGDGEPVFGIALNGQARAYPLRILDWHEMANDRVGGVPVALAYCTLCGAGIAYDRRAPDGETYDFGSSGLLMRSNKLMVDRQTRSLWNQFTGRPVVGPLADGPDFRLRVLPSVVTTWGEWKRRHPGTKVLSLETGFVRRYEPGAAYADYFASAGTLFPVRATVGIAPKTRIFGLERDGLARAWPIRSLARARVVNDRLGDGWVVLLAGPAPIEVEGRSARTGIVSHYEAGTAVRAYAAGERRFARVEAGDGVRDESGADWQVSEDALIGPTGERLPRLPGVQAYWFAWSIHHPNTTRYVDSGL
jgi:hypothetical protein